MELSFSAVDQQTADGPLSFACNLCRQYCTRRLRRLYKSLRFLHGRGRYQKKKLEPATIKDARSVQAIEDLDICWYLIPLLDMKPTFFQDLCPFSCRHLHIPLVSAERAWSYAMELKNQIEQVLEPHKRHHLIRRLSKVRHVSPLPHLVCCMCE